MLIQCPECELQISDKAIMCPHCGYPLKPEKVVTKRSSKKRKRLPNGFGQISEIKGRNLRKPFRAMVTVGKTETGRPICKPLKPESYFLTYNDAYAALIEYNKKPYELDNGITIRELYDRWSPIYFEKIKSISSIRAAKNAWDYCSAIYDMKVTDLRPRHIKYCMESGKKVINGEERYPLPNIQCKIKSIFNLMLDYALEFEIVDKNIARTFKISPEVMRETQTKSGHIPYTDKEIERLWEHVDEPGVDLVLIQCYSGWRPREICDLRIENIDLENRTMKGGMKTLAGIDRIIPIHSKILPLVEARYRHATENGLEYLFNISHGNSTDTRFTFECYKTFIKRLIKSLDLDPDHKPHDGRVHFVTNAKKCNVDEYAIKYIVGHVISDVTEKVYTKREFDWLRTELEKIK